MIYYFSCCTRGLFWLGFATETSHIGKPSRQPLVPDLGQAGNTFTGPTYCLCGCKGECQMGYAGEGDRKQ